MFKKNRRARESKDGKELDELGRNGGYLVQVKVCKNPNTLPSTLKWLYEHNGWGDVHTAIAANPNTPRDVLESIIQKYTKKMTPGIGKQVLLGSAATRDIRNISSGIVALASENLRKKMERKGE